MLYYHRAFAAFALAGIIFALPVPALAWGDEGHEIVALIADHYLNADARDKVHAMLAADADSLTKHDIASEATWADKYRDENGRRDHYSQTRNWHFVDLELSAPNLIQACFDRPSLPKGTVASDGPADDCVVDKIDQFTTELSSPTTDAEERTMALKFILHFVGDLHQPLHAADNHDQGGNLIKVSAEGIHAQNLHHYWDTEFVERLGTSPAGVASDLVSKITPSQLSQWQSGTPGDWAQQSFELARDHAYGHPTMIKSHTTYRLDATYVDDATQIVAMQLSRAGVRLAYILNSALSVRHN